MEGVPDHKPPRPSAQRCPRIPPQGEGALQAHRYELRDEGHFEWGHHVIWWSSSTPPENPVHESKVSAGGPDAGHRHLVARRSPERLCREGRSQHDTPHLRGPETLRGVESCHRHEEAQPTPAGPAVQASIHRRCSSPSPTQRLCHQDRPDGRLPSHRVQRGSAEVVRIRVEGSEVSVRSEIKCNYTLNLVNQDYQCDENLILVKIERREKHRAIAKLIDVAWNEKVSNSRHT